MTQWTSCKCEYCYPIAKGPPSTYLHAGAGDVWPANTDQARITPAMLDEAFQKGCQVGYGDRLQEFEAVRREGYDAGNEAGYEVGYEHGYSQGSDDGYSDGVADGHDEGFEDGYDAGYECGHEEGYEDGVIAEALTSGSFSEGYEAGYANRAAGLPSLLVDSEAQPHWIEGWGRV